MKEEENMLLFLRQYIKNPKKIGAIAPSGKRLANAMMRQIDFDSAECIVEFGPGTGAFTEELLRRRRNRTMLILIEQNEKFYHLLKERLGEQLNVTVVHGSAEDADLIMRKCNFSAADYIVSGLPFNSLPKETSLNVFRAAKEMLGENGVFITFQYTLLQRNFLAEHFRFRDMLHVYSNIPPAYVFVLKNR